MYSFNSRTREGCDNALISIFFSYKGFNSRTREGCDEPGAGSQIVATPFQFTHPGGVRLSPQQVSSSYGKVSIHAPGRGATCAPFRSRLVSPSFNSRTREGCDVLLSISFQKRTVSIHAPGRGATDSVRFWAGATYVSIHAPGRGATSSLPIDDADLRVSIHAPGRGATRGSRGASRRGRRFNSRTREGCDSCLGNTSQSLSSFNSRTREGCDTCLDTNSA